MRSKLLSVLGFVSLSAFAVDYQATVDPKTGIEWRQLRSRAVSLAELTNVVSQNCLAVPAPPKEFRDFQPLMSVAYDNSLSGISESLPSLEKNNAHFQKRRQRLNEALDNGLVIKGTDLVWLFADSNRNGGQQAFRGIVMNTKTRRVSEYFVKTGSSDGISKSDTERLATQKLAAALCYKLK